MRPEGTADFSTFQPRRWFIIRVILLIEGKGVVETTAADVLFRSDASVQKQGTA